MMPPSIPSPSLKIRLEHLSTHTFSDFGTLIQNPTHSTPNAASQKQAPTLKVVEANQGSATKYLDISVLSNHYGRAASGTRAKAVVNMFVCKPRPLRAESKEGGCVERVFDVGILERHPFTPQTFVPMGLDQGVRDTKYLVIVAPTLSSEPPKRSLLKRLWKSSQDDDELDHTPKGTGLPDLSRIRAFLADGSQAVTYGPGTWHAPMVVIGERPIDFVVIQYANGVGDEDCQEILLQPEAGKDGISVCVEVVPNAQKPIKARL